ncbi:NACHT domain protein [Tsuneonella dongtanensis]|uniref:NACHT domain protein n=1 Tax=Tsuneonella dongtanensis TaxID=692370 RepID=A0A1B2ACG7_9SPHN|nr:NACHT domain-containing protein [Tsuneonella dongtanensis]ANY19849.1 NACHT domain protein [Tsuneonella dongtanensis]
MNPSPTSSAIASASSAIGDTIGKKIGEAIIRSGSKILDKAKVSLEVGFRPYLEKNYARCRYYKTLLDPYEPCDLEATYINVKLHLKGRTAAEIVEDTKLINRFLDGEKFVVTGLAGCGKSMLMKSAVLRTYGSSNSLPLFFELRKLNGLKNVDLVEQIHEDCSQDGKEVSFGQFKLALRSGLFALILDGFDEIEYDQRKDISEQIIEFTTNYPQCPIIISSRPDNDVFGSWSEFKVFEVEKFDKRQTLALIDKAKYDEGVRKRFKEALEDRLFKTHGSFLQSPLLTIIMMFTFEEFAEIPTKMHAFYARAFDTLFQKHDADKDQFVRKIRTGLSREDFKLTLSCFCAISYLAEKFSFNADELNKFVGEGINYAKNVSPNVEPSSVDFIQDLRDAVCLIQEDGLNFVFVHRSFQEYFTAVFLDKVHESRIKALGDRLATRFNDDVLPMSLDMSREKMEQNWLIPNLDFYIDFLGSRTGRKNTATVFKGLLGQPYIFRERIYEKKESKDRIQFTFTDLPSETLGPLEIICVTEPKLVGAAFLIKSVRQLTVENARRVLLKEQYARRKSYATWRNLLQPIADNRQPPTIRFPITAADDWWLNELGFDETFDELASILTVIKRDVERRVENRRKLLDDLIG